MKTQNGEIVTPTRRVIVSTNIAETGITIETLKYARLVVMLLYVQIKKGTSEKPPRVYQKQNRRQYKTSLTVDHSRNCT